MKPWISLLLLATIVPPALPQAPMAKVPSWDARGVGPLPRMGITSLDVSDDGKEIVVGTIAAFGDPNVIVLSDAGKIVRTYKVGQQWIDNVAFVAGSQNVLAICTMPAGKAGDRVEVFRCLPSPLRGRGAGGEGAECEVIPEKTKQEGVWFFHYGDHSNHPTMKLARRAGSVSDRSGATALLAANQLVIYRKDKEPVTLRVPVSDPDAAVSLAVDETGWAVVGTTSRDREGASNLYLFDPDQKKPVWSRAVNKDVDKAPALEKGLYGTPTLPDGTRKELPQRDEKVWAPLSVAIHSPAGSASDRKRLIAAADYQGWQRWVRSSATMKEENQGLRFVPTKPTVSLYDETGKLIHNLAADKFKDQVWCDLALDNKYLTVQWSHRWRCRGVGGQVILPVEDSLGYFIFQHRPTTQLVAFEKSRPHDHKSLNLSYDFPDNRRLLADCNGTVILSKMNREIWRADLTTAVPKSLKPWVANARATPIVPGVWQIPGGRVESDLGGQRVIEAPDGLILIEGHAGLSFEREWASMVAVGLDPMKVKYVLATHEHGDHAPGAYLWRVVTGAKFVCSEEMAYTLQHHIPLNTGYGLHPPVPTDIVIEKDTELDLAGLKVRAIRIPGHTAGSMAWYFEMASRERKRPEKRPVSFVAFGDLIMPRGVLGYSGSVNFSATDILSSLRKLHDLKVDYVLPGHGAVEGPGNYFQSGIDVGVAAGWGFIKPEKPDPRFRITQKNVVVVGWGHGATSAAFGDLNGDGKPDVAIVCPDGDRSVVKIFFNHGGKFNDKPDHEIKVPTVSQPHKVRILMMKFGIPALLVAGKPAALLAPTLGEARVAGKLPTFTVIPFDMGDANHLRILDGKLLVSRRFGGFFELDLSKKKTTTRKSVPEIDGPYVDFHHNVNGYLLTSYGQAYLFLGRDLQSPDKILKYVPAWQLPREKDWTFLAVGDFNGDGKPDAALLSYGMDKSTAARVFYNTGKADRPFAEKADAVISLTSLLKSAKKGNAPPLVRDTPVVADWNGDGIDDLIVAHGQCDEVLVLLGGKDGLSNERVQRIQLDYRVHYEHGVYVGDFNGDGKMDLAVFGYTNTGVGGPSAAYLWLQ